MLTRLLRAAPGLQKAISSRDYSFCVLSQRRFLFVGLAGLLPAGRGGWHWIAPRGSTKDNLPQVWPGPGCCNSQICFSSGPWLMSPSPRHWQQRWLFADVPPASLSILPSLLPGSPHPCPMGLLFTRPAENSLSLQFYLSGDCLTTNTSFMPFLSLDNLEFMQGCGSRKIQVQAERLVRLWLRQAVFTQQ